MISMYNGLPYKKNNCALARAIGQSVIKILPTGNCD